MKALQTQLAENQGFFFQTHTKSPSFHWLALVKETEKALQVKNETTGKVTWLPKAALVHLPKLDSFTLTNWFRKSLWAEQWKNTHTLKALGLAA